ncbi:MAG: regulatory protein RecX [Bacillota bacterium]
MENKARETALSLLARKPRTTAEVRRELARRSFAPEIVSGVIAYLEDRHLIDDVEYIQYWVEHHHRAGRSVGRWRLEQELRARGIPGEIVSQEVSRWVEPHGELQGAMSLACRQMGKCGEKPSEDAWPRVARFLYRRGYTSETIDLVWREIKGRSGFGQET